MLKILLFWILSAIVATKTTSGCSDYIPGMAETRKVGNLVLGLEAQTKTVASDLCLAWGGKPHAPLFDPLKIRSLANRKKIRSNICLAGFFVDAGLFVDRSKRNLLVQFCLHEVLHPLLGRLKNGGACQNLKLLLCVKKRKKYVAPTKCPHAHAQRILPITWLPDCNKNKIENRWNVVDWVQDPDLKWDIRNTGYDLEIRPIGSLQTKINIGSIPAYLNVNKIKIKWGKHAKRGSEHTYEQYSYAGEIQIFHESDVRIGGKHAISIFLSERHNPPNPAWEDFINSAVMNGRLIESKHSSTTPPSLRNLLGEDAAQPGRVYLTHRLLDYVRYSGSTSETPCEEVIWTVYKNPVLLSKTQFVKLRSISHRHQPHSSTTPDSWSHNNSNICRITGYLWRK